MNKNKSEVQLPKPTEPEEVKIIRSKIVLIGDGGIGKSCIVNQLCHEYFTDSYKQTLGCDFYTKVITINEKIQLHMQLWDVGRKSMDSKMIDAYIVGSDTIIFVYDVTRKATFGYLDECLALVKKLYGKKTITNTWTYRE